MWVAPFALALGYTWKLGGMMGESSVYYWSTGKTVALLLIFLGQLACIAAMIRLALAGVVVRQEGVVVRNVLSSRSFAWGEIERFDPPDGKHWSRTVSLVSADGQRERLTGCGSPPIAPRAGERLARQLNELHQQALSRQHPVGVAAT